MQSENCCVDYTGLKIKAIGLHGDCRWGILPNMQFNLEQLTPHNMCLAAFHTAIPYILTLKNGGRFAWLRDRNVVIFQCPNPEVAVVMNLSIHEEKDHQFSIEVIKTRGTCPQKMLPFNMFTLNRNSIPFCPKAMDSLFPYVNMLNAIKQNPCNKSPEALRVVCPGYPNYLIFEISYSKDIG